MPMLYYIIDIIIILRIINCTAAVYHFLLGPGYIRYYRNAVCAYIIFAAGRDKVIK